MLAQVSSPPNTGSSTDIMENKQWCGDRTCVIGGIDTGDLPERDGPASHFDRWLARTWGDMVVEARLAGQD